MTELTRYKKYKKTYQAYYQAHKEKMDEQIRQWTLKHPERKRYLNRRWSEAHPERKKEAGRKRLVQHREYNKMYRQTYPEKVKAHHLMSNNPKKYPLAIECEFCASSKNLEHGHIDYAYPELYVTVCHACNCCMEVFSAK